MLLIHLVSTVAVTASSTGILFSIGLDQIVMHYFEGHGENLHGTFVSTIDTGNDEGNSHELSPLSRYDSESSPPAEHMVLSVPMAKMYVLEAAIAAHSIILGFGFGVLDPIETMKKAATLIAAYSIHQFFEGAGIAITIIDLLKNKERKNITIPFGLIFSLAFPFGAVIGLANSSDTFESQLLQGIANAFAGGVLLYSSLVEMISADFSKIILNRRPFLRLTMFISVVCGFLCMAFLATME